ncbi:hypothetical protein GI582_24450 [Sulfitobacter sp. BDSS02]|uniref:hypothetical protein n=1 Tax=Heliomarina sp. TaxID=2917556 RepID=UPI004058280E|nr:hypothetical protein [Sulfitobacter sp. BDSS02]MBR9852424.1 hypothetical protein [Paracoccaceae bacterium]
MFQLPHAPWQTNLKTGDVVAFTFPQGLDGIDAGNARPALVLSVVESAGELFVDLAFVTRRHRTKRGGRTVTISDRDELLAASLRAATTFDIDRRLTVSVRNSRFHVNGKTGTAVLGRLSGQSLRQVEGVNARLQRRAEVKSRPNFRRRKDPRQVRVEYRKRGRTVAREMRYI